MKSIHTSLSRYDSDYHQHIHYMLYDYYGFHFYRDKNDSIFRYRSIKSYCSNRKLILFYGNTRNRKLCCFIESVKVYKTSSLNQLVMPRRIYSISARSQKVLNPEDSLHIVKHIVLDAISVHGWKAKEDAPSYLSECL